MWRFNKYYFSVAVVIFSVEVLIAIFLRDRFIRPYFGDVLVVILMYSFVRSFFKLPVLPLALGVLAFSFMVEFLQYLRIVYSLGLEKSAIVRTVIGTSFAWNDILAYIAGIAIVLLVERYLLNRRLDTRT